MVPQGQLQVQMSRSLGLIGTAIQSTSVYLYFYLYFNTRPIPLYSQVSKLNSPYSRTKMCTFVHWSIHCLDLQFHSSVTSPSWGWRYIWCRTGGFSDQFHLRLLIQMDHHYLRSLVVKKFTAF